MEWDWRPRQRADARHNTPPLQQALSQSFCSTRYTVDSVYSRYTTQYSQCRYSVSHCMRRVRARSGTRESPTPPTRVTFQRYRYFQHRVVTKYQPKYICHCTAHTIHYYTYLRVTSYKWGIRYLLSQVVGSQVLHLHSGRIRIFESH